MPHDKDKKKRKVQRLVDVDVTHVSLVDRPANQTPFKFVKRDEGTESKGTFPMNISIKNMFGSRAPEVTSVIAATAAQAVAVSKMLLDIENPEAVETDGVFVVRKSGTKPEGEKVIHLGKKAGVAYTVANLQKELALFDMDADSFDDALKQEGFVPGLFIGMDALHTTIRNAAMDEDTNSPEALRTKVTKALEDFSAYVDSLISALPEKAFKFEKAMIGVIAPNDLGAIRPTEDGFNSAVYDAIFGDEDETAENADATGEADDTAKEADAATDAGEGAAEVEQAETSAADDAGEGGAADADGEPGGEEAEAAPANLEELPKTPADAEPAGDQNAALAEALEGLTKNIGTQITDALKPLSDRMDAQDQAIGKLSKAMGSTVAGTPDQDDDDNVVQLNKGETATGDIPLMDTAYRSRSQG